MGMSASQCRLLSLTARLSDLEFRAQGISNSKIQLSQASENASNEYLDALDKQKLTVYNSDTSAYVDATAYNLTTYNAISTLDKQRMLKTASGQLVVSEDIKSAYENAMGKTFSVGFTDDFTALYEQAVLDTEESQAKIAQARSSSANSAAASSASAGNSVAETNANIALAAVAGAANATNAITAEADASLTTFGANASSSSLQTNFKTVGSFLNATLGYSTIDEYNTQYPEATTAEQTAAKNQITYYTNIYSGKEAFLNSQGYTSNANNTDEDLSYDTSANKYYGNVFDEISENGTYTIKDSDLNDYEWLYNQLNNGNIYLSEYDSDGGENGTGDWEEVSWSSGDSSLAEDDDDTTIAKAEAKYNATLAEIQTKDKRFDLDLKSIDTEHSAIQTEFESVKKVIDKNIERSFKIFDA